jgi:hypothetical protein
MPKAKIPFCPPAAQKARMIGALSTPNKIQKQQSNNKGKRLKTKTMYQRIALNSFLPSCLQCNLSDDFTKARIGILANDIGLTFKETYKWLWDKKEKYLRGSYNNIKKKINFKHLSMYPIDQPVLPVFLIQRVKK